MGLSEAKPILLVKAMGFAALNPSYALEILTAPLRA
jgi:hypothetical protein